MFEDPNAGDSSLASDPPIGSGDGVTSDSDVKGFEEEEKEAALSDPPIGTGDGIISDPPVGTGGNG